MEPQSSGILHTNLRTSQLGRPRISGAHLASRDAPRTSGLRPSVLGASLDARCAPSMLCRLPHGASPLGAPSLLGSFGLYVKSLTFRLHSCIVTLSLFPPFKLPSLNDEYCEGLEEICFKKQVLTMRILGQNKQNVLYLWCLRSKQSGESVNRFSG